MKDISVPIQSITKEIASCAHSLEKISQKMHLLSANNASMNAGFATTDIMSIITIFILASIIGYYVIWHVTPSLHTPLMSLTNAISGIILIGAMLSVSTSSVSIVSFAGLLAIFLASINIFGGFMVTQRMLAMFKKKK